MKGVRQRLGQIFRITVLLAIVLANLAVVRPAYADGADPVINEFVFNHTGTDYNEYIEIYGDPGTDYSAYTLLEIEGDSGSTLGVVDDAIPVGTTDGSGFWWTGFVSNQVENGTVTLLLVEGFTGAEGDDLDADDDGVIDSTPWVRIVDDVAINDGGADDLTYAVTVLTVGYDGMSYAPGGASRIPDGADSDLPADWVRNDFDLAGIEGFTGTPDEGEALNTPGLPNEIVTALIPTALTLTSSLNPADEGEEVTFTAFVEEVPAGAIPTGDVRFLDGGTELAVVALDGTGTAAFSTSALAEGTHAIAAEYDGDTLHAGSSNTLDQVIEGAPAPPADPVINEFVFNHTGTDYNEYIEIFGDPATDYSAYTLLEIEGDSGATMGVVDEAIPVGTTDGSGFWWTGFVPNQVENGTVTLLLVEGFTGAAGDDLDVDDDGVFDSAPWVRIVDDVGINDGGADDLTYAVTVLTVGYDGMSYAPGGASRIPDGADSDLPADWVRNDFDLAGIEGFTGTPVEGEALNTPGAPNEVYAYQPPDILINEVDADTAGTDILEFVELYDGGAGNTPLDGLVLVFYNGNGDLSYAAYDLTGYSTDANGYFLLGNADVSPTPSIIFPSNGLQNGADAVALYSADVSAFPSGTPVTTEGLIDAVVYDTNDGDDSGLLVLLNSGQPQLNEDGAGDKDFHSNQRCPDGSGGARNTDTFIQDVPTPGAENCYVAPPEILINEVDADTAGTDMMEFIELFDGGDGNTPLDGLVLVLFNGNGDVAYNAFDLDGYSTDANGYFLLGNADVSPTPSIIFPSNGLQNGADAVALYSGDAADFPSGTPVTTEGLIDAVVYDTNDGDDAGLLVLLNGGQPQLNEDGAGDKDGHSNQRCPDGSGGARNTDTFVQEPPTPGAENCVAPPEACGDPFTPIYTVQGSDMASPIVGAEVSVEGVVVGDFQAGDELNGFYIQDPLGDGDPATSDGIFVYAPASLDVAVGDAVRVHGFVAEYYDLTELTSVSTVWLCGEGEPIAPTAVDLPVSDLGQWEPLEGMLVTIPEALSVTEHYNLGRYGEVLLSADGRLYNPTNDQGGDPDLNSRRAILLDDGSTVQNPATVPYLSVDDTLRLGDVTVGLTGVLSYDYDVYRLQPTEDVVFARVNERTSAPDDVGGTIRVASFNVLNYFTTLGSRGASTAEEFERQQAKIVEAILAIDADVIGLIEIENNGPIAVENLVAALNAASEPGRYAAIADPPEGLGDDEIKVAIIYQPARVTPVGSAMTDLDPIFDRPPLAQTFEASGEIFTVVVNHFKSKGSCPEDPTDPNADYGQGCWNVKRTQQAAQLMVFIASLEAISGDEDVIVLGDLNSYGQEDPIDLLVAAGLTNQVAAYVPLAERYSYVYDGLSGYLDHALTTFGLDGRVTGVDIWHINADEPRILDYNQEYNPPYLYEPDAYRSSDHDPVILGFCEAVPPEITITLTPDVLWPANHKYVDVEAVVEVVDNTDPAPVLTFISITSNEPDNGEGDGNTVDDILVLDDFHFRLRAERAGGGEGRVYTVYYAAQDACGNVTIASATVTVPLSQAP